MATVGIVVKSEHEAWIATPMTGHPSALHKTRRETAKLLAPEVAVTTLTSLTRTAPSAFVTSLESPSADILTYDLHFHECKAGLRLRTRRAPCHSAEAPSATKAREQVRLRLRRPLRLIRYNCCGETRRQMKFAERTLFGFPNYISNL